MQNHIGIGQTAPANPALAAEARQPHVLQQAQRLESLAIEIGNALERLDEKLNPILSAPWPTAGKEEAAESTGVRLADYLLGIGDRLEYELMHINNLTARAEV